MDDLRITTDPARIHAAMCEARRLRNEVMRDLFKALFDGRFLALFTGGKDKPSANDLPRGTATQG